MPYGCAYANNIHWPGILWSNLSASVITAKEIIASL